MLVSISRFLEVLDRSDSARAAALELGIHPTTLKKVCHRLGGQLVHSYAEAVSRGNSSKAYNLP